MSHTVLIADDDPELCELYQTFLARLGYRVETAADGLDCVAKLRRLTPSVLVLDSELRWGGGDGVLAWLREENALDGIPVILTGTAGHHQDLPDVVEPPVVYYLPKPFALAAFLECVQSAVAMKRRPEPTTWNGDAAHSELFIG
jgi:DNA-binding response OmpR family regulator